MRSGLSGDHGLFGTATRLGEVAELHTAPDQPCAGENRRQASLPEPLICPLAGEVVDVRPEYLDAPPVFAERIVSLAEPEVRGHSEREVAEAVGDLLGSQTGIDRLVVLAHPGKELTHVSGQLP